MEFGGCFDSRFELVVKATKPFSNFRSHRDSFLDVFDLRLKDGDAIIDDRTFFELRTLFACGVLGELWIISPIYESVTVNGAISDTTERTGEGLDGLILCECYSCHNDLKFEG